MALWLSPRGGERQMHLNLLAALPLSSYRALCLILNAFSAEGEVCTPFLWASRVS